MSGLDVAASAAGLISLSLTLFRGCVQGFVLLGKAISQSKDADMVRCKLEWEQFRLMQWAEKIDLENAPQGRLNWSLIADTLKKLEALLTSSKELRERYHLDVAEIDSKVVQESSNQADTASKRYISLRHVLLKFKPTFASTSDRIVSEQVSPAKKLQWAVLDAAKLNGLLSEITYFNQCLHSVLESVDRDFLESALSCLLRAAIARSSLTSELDVMKELIGQTSVTSPESVQSAATLKQIRIALGLVKTSDNVLRTSTTDSSIGKPKLTYLKPRHLLREQVASHPQGRELARYKSEPILIEWRLIERKSEVTIKPSVDQLAILLSNTNDATFHSLHCVGVLPKDDSYGAEAESQVCYGLAFSVPSTPAIQAASLGNPVISTLQDLLRKKAKPSLNERLATSISLAETVLQLHTAGWLHKGLRSSSVLFIYSQGHTKGPYLAGYEYSRPTSAETEAVPDRREHEIYRHPLAQGPARATFNKSFDLFALGCILLELAMWSDLQTILEKKAADPGRKPTQNVHREGLTGWWLIMKTRDNMLCNDAKSRALDDVAFYVGKTFKEAILKCLYPETDSKGDEGLEAQMDILNKLESCRF